MLRMVQVDFRKDALVKNIWEALH